MIKVYSKIEEVRDQWGGLKTPIFLDINFLQVYYENHPQIKHLFAMSENMRLYAHIFQITFDKTESYLRGNAIFSKVLGFLNFNVLYLTNSFITNVPAFSSENPISLQELLNQVQLKYSMVVIPDFLYNSLDVEKAMYTKIEVEEEMVLDIQSSWKSLDDYIINLKKKYRNKVRSILKQTSNLKIIAMDTDMLRSNALKIQELFDQVARDSNFKGPAFNTSTFISFVEKGIMKVDGYFDDDKLVGFSSVLPNEKIIYSYFVGFDKTLNKSTPIYGRILLENISAAIKGNYEQLILGRTANEFKSNFGAYPVKSYVYLRIQNRLLRVILMPILRRFRLKPWIQRRPFIE